jgi:hypothetical protein
MDHIFSIGQVGRRLGIQPYRISYAIETGQLPDAPFHFLHKRCFTERDIQGIAEFFGVTNNLEVERQKETT